MKTLCVLFLIGLVSHHALAFRLKRQTNVQGSDVDDRYGWLLETMLESQGQSLNQGQFPGLLPEQFPGQFPEKFPGQFPEQFPGQFPEEYPGQFLGDQQQQLTTSTTATPSTTSSFGVEDAAATRACIAQCPVTSEYNPVCGSDRTTYTNPGRLECAKLCGVNVTLFRSSPCPPSIVTPQ